MNVLIYTIETQDYGLPVHKVNAVVLASEIQPIPHSPDYIEGAINVHNQVVPVINTRLLFGWQRRELEITDHFILYAFNEKLVALWIDRVKNVKFYKEEELIPAQQMMADIAGLEYVLKEDNQMIYLYDIEKMLVQ